MTSEWHTGDQSGPFLTQGAAGYVGQQRDTALAFTWQAAHDALAATQVILTKCDAILAAIANLVPGTGGGIGPADLAAAVADLKAEVRDAVADLGEGGAVQVRADPDAHP